MIELIKDDKAFTENINSKTDLGYEINSLNKNILDTIDDTRDRKITTFLTNLEANSTPTDNGERPNPHFKTNVLKLAKHFPLSIGVMSALVASSACSEEYFREVKQLVFRGAKNMRVKQISHNAH